MKLLLKLLLKLLQRLPPLLPALYQLSLDLGRVYLRRAHQQGGPQPPLHCRLSLMALQLVALVLQQKPSAAFRSLITALLPKLLQPTMLMLRRSRRSFSHEGWSTPETCVI